MLVEFDLDITAGETREIQIPSSYARASRVDRTVTEFSQTPAGTGWR